MSAPARELVLTLLSIIDEHSSDCLENEPTLSQSVTNLDSRTKLKLKSLCDDITGHVQNVSSHPVHKMSNSSTQYLDSLKVMNEASTLRMAFGSFQNMPMDKLVVILASFMSDRHDRVSVMPLTQDDQDQLDIITSANVALTISNLSLSAAKMYTSIIGMKGAWSAGLIDEGALSSLSALIKRWCDECRGREKICNDFDTDDDESHISSTARRKMKRGKTSNSRASKRRKRQDPDYVDDDDDDKDDPIGICDLTDDEKLDEFINNDCSTKLNETNAAYHLIRSGLELGFLLSSPLALDEFRHWSSDAKESFLDSVVTCMATVAALLPTIGDVKFSDTDMVPLINDVLQRLKESVISFMTSSNNTGVDRGLINHNQVVNRGMDTMNPSLNRGQSSRYHEEEGSLCVLRALYPFLTLQSILPNGSKGKVAAFDLVGSVLKETLHQRAGINMILSKNHTPVSNRKPYTSDERNKVTASTNNQPRTFYSVCLGMMQKLVTSPLLAKTDARERCLDCVMSWLQELPDLQKSQFLAFSNQMCRSKLSCHRLVGCEILEDILTSSWGWKVCVDENIGNMTPSAHQTPIVRQTGLVSSINSLTGRLADRLPIVRARAAYSIMTVFNNLVKNSDTDSIIQESAARAVISYCPGLLSQLSTQVSTDDRATVRRAAIVAYSSILYFLVDCPVSHNIFAERVDMSGFSLALSDTSVYVRKAAVEAVTKILSSLYNRNDEQHCMRYSLEQLWVDSVLPLVTDVESSCASEVVKSFISLILDPIITVDVNATITEDDMPQMVCMSSWALLSKVVECSFHPGSTRSGTRALLCAMEKSLQTFNTSSRTMLKTLLNRLHHSIVLSLDMDDCIGRLRPSDRYSRLNCICYGSWAMLEAIFETHSVTFKQSKINAAFLFLAWKKLLGYYKAEKHLYLLVSMRSCLLVLSRVIPSAKQEDVISVTDSLSSALATFSLDPKLIGAMILTLSVISERTCSAESTSNGIDAGDEWIMDLYARAESILDQYVSGCITGTAEVKRVKNAIFTIGELSLIGFTSDERSDIRKDISNNKSGFQKPSTKIVTLVQAALLPKLPRLSTELLETSSDESVRAHAFITLGKLCIRDQNLARDSVNIFAQELGGNSHRSTVAIQNNAMMVMGDLCIKYTHLVSKFLPIIASCLQFRISTDESIVTTHNSSLVRRQAVLLLSSLILQGYIKLRGTLFYRFLIAAVDTDTGVSNLATLTLCGPLQTKYTRLFYNNFVETLFVLNACESHPIHRTGLMDDQGDIATKSVTYLSGDDFKQKRMDVYYLLLANMSDEEKIGITARLAKEILAVATESQGDLAYACQQVFVSSSTLRESDKRVYEKRLRACSVISDCFSILTSPCLRITRNSGKAVDDDDLEQSQSNAAVGPTSAQLNAVKGRLLTKISRKQLIETVLPILCRLKSILESNKSSLLKGLMLYMVSIFRQFKTEVREVLASEPTLLQELEYDTKRFENDSSFSDLVDADQEYD